MADLIEVKVPDIGSAQAATVIEVAVKPGDSIQPEQTLITLEGEKATMEVPASQAGIVQEVKVKVGDKVREGSVILTLEGDQLAASKPEPTAQEKDIQQPTASLTQVDVTLPDLGSTANAAVIEVNVKVGDKITKEQTLLTLEGEKATMEVPSPHTGVIKAILVGLGDKVATGQRCMQMEIEEQPTAIQTKSLTQVPTPSVAPSPSITPQPAIAILDFSSAHASPKVRRFARELGVDLTRLKGTGPKGRILKQDVQAYVKAILQRDASVGSGLPSAPQIDFAKFGAVETRPLSRIKKYTATNLHRNWLLVPHVTQYADADITALEAYRKSQQAAAEKAGVKLTPLVFIMKAVVSTLKEFPQFNASLDPQGEQLILKKYFHIGIAVDTAEGLVVPVIRDVDQKSSFNLAKELAEISHKARTKGLTPQEMQGGCFTISSLGGIGGRSFTPIINMPEVAILGVSKAEMKPVYQDGQFIARLMLPLSLSYDHRVIDGAEGARFIVYLANCLKEKHELLL